MNHSDKLWLLAQSVLKQSARCLFNISRLKIINKCCRKYINLRNFEENIARLAINASYYIYLSIQIYERMGRNYFSVYVVLLSETKKNSPNPNLILNTYTI